MAEDNWKDTLYIWDGIVKEEVPEDKETQDTPGSLQWEGYWIPVTNVPDAADAEAPKRHPFKRDIDADCKFLVRGTVTRLYTEGETNGGGASTNDDDNFYVVKLTEGDGWEMEDGAKKTWYTDTTHDVWIKSLKWSGNQKDQRESLVVAKGTNAFGPFVSVGWVRPGNRWTLARRYLSETDLRDKMPFHKFYEIVVGASITVDKETGNKVLLVPPWRTAAMHAKYEEPAKETPENDNIGGGKRRKTVTM